ncbi:glycosyltransferase [Actinobaculum sp. 352]|uniref:glycosyltransferase n=1 Tax=Actinobaculum sp. 352 TaxID=2490946 RepID=UPI000F7F035B|nr:glycosyltransferase [Actinobaculum sp. 352]RTE48559.1 glycosyltransferase [Actinobaculum sp. 352]
MIVLIPSLEPDHRLPALVDALAHHIPEAHVVIVDDGSGARYADTFQKARNAGATVIGYEVNRGKGFALRTGFAWCLEHAPDEPVICADSDGQHTPDDIRKVAFDLRDHPNAVVLGVRAFSGRVPIRSRIGNWMSARFFRLASGQRISDTQTGLRGYGPQHLARLLGIPGDRFEWELQALLAVARVGQEIRQVPIATVYHDGNSGSHFRPLVDSWLVLRPLLAFFAVGAGCWAGEMLLFLVLQSRWGIFPAVVASRVVSGTVNFALNKSQVFREHSRERTALEAFEYALLAATLVTITALGVRALASIGIALWLAKLLMDFLCLLLSFAVQQRWIFAPPTLSAADTAGDTASDARGTAAPIQRPGKLSAG